MDVLLYPFFWVYEGVTKFLRKYYREIRIALLLIAHASLFGLFFPGLRNGFGEWSRDLLVLILFVSPLARIFPISLFHLIMGMRRELGILFAYLATVHGIGYLMDPVWFPLPLSSYVASPSQMGYPLLLGVAAYILTLPLLFTSNAFSIRFLKKRWKPLHRLTYVVFVLGMIHAFAIRHASGIWDAAFVISVYLALKVLAKSPNVAPILLIRKIVGSKHRHFQTRE